MPLSFDIFIFLSIFGSLLKAYKFLSPNLYTILFMLSLLPRGFYGIIPLK